jgi:hypothetical protein
MQWMDIGRFLIIVGIVITVLGFLFLISDKFPLGKLPGDFNFGKNTFRISIPITTCILVSIILTLIVNFFSRR